MSGASGKLFKANLRTISLRDGAHDSVCNTADNITPCRLQQLNDHDNMPWNLGDDDATEQDCQLVDGREGPRQLPAECRRLTKIPSITSCQAPDAEGVSRCEYARLAAFFLFSGLIPEISVKGPFSLHTTIGLLDMVKVSKHHPAAING